MLQESFNKLLSFCHITVASFSSYFCWQLTCTDLLNLQASFIFMKYSCRSLSSTPYLRFLIEDHSLWFSSALLFFHSLFGWCMHELCLPWNKIVFSLYIFKGFLSLSILALLEDLSWNKNCWICQCCWGWFMFDFWENCLSISKYW